MSTEVFHERLGYDPSASTRAVNNQLEAGLGPKDLAAKPRQIEQGQEPLRVPQVDRPVQRSTVPTMPVAPQEASLGGITTQLVKNRLEFVNS